MKPVFDVRAIYNNTAQLRAAMKALTNQDVYVGVPEEKADRRLKANDEERAALPMTNAYLSYIHEYGVPEKNIPARPHLMPGIAAIVPDAIAILRKAARDALEGKTGAVNRALNRIGLLGQRSVRTMFVNNDWQALADRTLNARRKTGERVGKKGKVTPIYSKTRAETGKINPLLLTAQLRNAHTYVIRRRGGGEIIAE